MTGLTGKLPADMHVGLMAYGHRRKGDCSDMEMLVPVGRFHRAEMKPAIKYIRPKGKTSLGQAFLLVPSFLSSGGVLSASGTT